MAYLAYLAVPEGKKMGFLELLKETEARIDHRWILTEVGQVIGGHTVSRVIWQTETVVIFQDPEGRFWRYLHSWGRAWPVVVQSKKESV